MPAPVAVSQWLAENYPRPRIDSEWLDACCEWIIEESNLDANDPVNHPRIISNVESQLLQSDLRDSAVTGTGLPANLATIKVGKLSGPPVLVEVAAITEIGHSAFQLQNVRHTRIDRADLAGLNAERGDDGQAEEEEEGPVPRYPRSMLKLELTDGTTTIKAVELKRIPELVLGDTPLGYKMLLKNVSIRRGIAFLEPSTVILKGFQTEDREVNQDADFVRSLRVRMGLPEVDPDALPTPLPPAPAPPIQPPAAVPVPAPHAPNGLAITRRPPAQEISPSEMEAFFEDPIEDDFGPPANKLPAASTTTTQVPPATGSTDQTLVASRYWSANGSSNNASAGPSTVVTQASERTQTTRERVPLFLPDDDEDEKPLARPAPGAAPIPRALARADPGSDYSFTDDSMLMDEAAFEAIAAAEVAASQQTRSASSPAPARGSSTVRSEIITIDSDEDVDEGKRKQAALSSAARNVKRKVLEERGARRGGSVASKPPVSDDVIEISD